MTADQPYTNIGSNVVVVVGVFGTFLWCTVVRLDRQIDNDKAVADGDRRACQAAMDCFRKGMQRLAERQSNLESACRISFA